MNAKKYQFCLLIQRMAGSAFYQRPTAHCKGAESHNKCLNINKLAVKPGSARGSYIHGINKDGERLLMGVDSLVF
ncbi:MAG: hypothetical protein A2X80_11705 [Geobacteraceae bacterium GWB2_52_12]|nr:MAG: hypothetical protein A2X80_11705 [Geobacteraceae bacterium GWB2_52_12]